MAGVASSRMGDHQVFLATNPFHTYKNVFSTVPSPTKNLQTNKTANALSFRAQKKKARQQDGQEHVR